MLMIYDLSLSLSVCVCVIFNLKNFRKQASKQANEQWALALLNILPHIPGKIIPLFYSFSQEIEEQVNIPNSVWGVPYLDTKT